MFSHTDSSVDFPLSELFSLDVEFRAPFFILKLSTWFQSDADSSLCARPSFLYLVQVADLAVASPATVSRCGMVYLEPGYIGLDPFVYCWLKRVPDVIVPYTDQLNSLFSRFLQVCARVLVGCVITKRNLVWSFFIDIYHRKPTDPPVQRTLWPHHICLEVTWPFEVGEQERQLPCRSLKKWKICQNPSIFEKNKETS